MLLVVIFNQRNDPLFLDGFQCCCDLHNRPIRNLVKWRSLACGDIYWENFHYSIQDSGVIIDHGGETWIGQGGGTRGCASTKKSWKRAWGVSQWLLMERKSISHGEGRCRGACGGTSILIRSEKGLRSVPSVLFSCPLNGSLVSFVIILLTDELCSLMLSHRCFRCLISLHFLPWYITSL